MKICISGAQGTGKSTLVEALAETELADTYTFETNLTRGIKDQGYNINELGDNNTQILILAEHLKRYTSNNVILDRCSLDGLVYTAYLYEKGFVNKSTLRLAEAVFENLRYDLLFFIKPEFDLEDDGVRSIDQHFKDRIVELFDEYMTSYKINAIMLSGTVEERVEKVLSTIKDIMENSDG